MGTENLQDIKDTGNTSTQTGNMDTQPRDSVSGSIDAEKLKQKRCSNPNEEIIDKSGISGKLPRFMRVAFADRKLENLYTEYFARSKRKGILVFLIFTIVFDLAVIIKCAIGYDSANGRSIVPISLGLVFLIAEVVFFAMCYKRKFSESLCTAMPFIIWAMYTIKLLIYVGLQLYTMGVLSADEGMGYQLLMTYAIYGLMPLQLRYCAILSVTSGMLHMLLLIILTATQQQQYFYVANQIIADVLLMFCVHAIGIIAYYFSDKLQRKAFLEIRVSLSMKVVIEEGSREQQRLLLSVLPKHVAEEMIRDLGTDLAKGQFRKIYMSRHENVSILFADIVGFTALSSTCTASQLVKILNELFATFDKLADKYHQLRIKILGDCYYCISGAPKPRPDHSVLCVHMGLAMVEAIKDVAKATNSGVNMRVGIHTGAVLGGVTGQKQWQFDVLGKEVTLANKMESGGVPGRVHISDNTMGFLNGEFELEPGEGDVREEALRMAGIKTYLIKSVLKPYPEGTLDEALMPGEKKDEEEEDSISPVIVENIEMYAQMIDSDATGYMDLNIVTLQFKEKALEEQFNSNKQRFSGAAIACSPFLLLVCFLTQLCVLPKHISGFLTFLIAEILLLPLSFIPLATNFPDVFPKKLVIFADWVETTRWFRTIWAVFVIFIVSSADFLDMFFCDLKSPTSVPLDPSAATCDYPSYFIFFVVVILLCVAHMVQLSYVVKGVIILLLTTLYCLVNTLILPQLFDRYDARVYSKLRLSSQPFLATKYSTAILLITVAVTLIVYTRYVEMTSRVMFLWRQEADNEKENVAGMRTRNETLINNIMPAHVARDFLGQKKDDKELYSQAYDEVGVMFAACPNFNDYYSEDSINNNGLEWMRFLNEIISDYDELLNKPKFKEIVKIKTIGSTYMASSGMTGNTVFPKDAPVTQRWQHLADLVEFAFELKRSLDAINAESYNRFVLRIGINQGPVLAGVIGARKPHYDIWGNSVNVASRMESTGQAGRIQVIEATKDILEEFGYTFEKRGVINVKGKGQLTTYFLVGRAPPAGSRTSLPNQVCTLYDTT